MQDTVKISMTRGHHGVSIVARSVSREALLQWREGYLREWPSPAYGTVVGAVPTEPNAEGSFAVNAARFDSCG